MNLDSFDALTFDCYGTLIDWERGILDTLDPWRRRHGLDLADEQLLQAFADSEARQEAATPGKLYPQVLVDVLEDIAGRHGVSATAEECRAFGESIRDWPAFADSPGALRYLKQRYKLAIISNVDRASFAHSQATLGIEFDAIITAEDVGSYKPDPRNFEYALARLEEIGVERRAVLHVAQSLFHDHEPAKKLGLHTVWVDRRAGKPGWGATHAPLTSIRPDLVVNDLAQLAAIHSGGCRGESG